MGKTGKPTIIYDLTESPTEVVANEFEKMDKAVRAGQFEADPEPSKCRFCSVATSCEFAAG